MSYFSIFFVYLYYPMKFERKFLKGPPPWPPPVLKNQAPPAEKKLDPLPWAFGARPRMVIIRYTNRLKSVFDERMECSSFNNGPLRRVQGLGLVHGVTRTSLVKEIS